MNAPSWLLTLLSVLEGILLFRVWLAWRGRGRRAVAAPRPVSVVIPLYGWDQGLPALLDGLLSQRYDAEIQVVLVIDADHPRRGELPVDPLLLLLAPKPRPDGWHDKVWRMRCGAEAATHQAVMFMDSDVVVDPDWMALRVGQHQADFSWAIPVYAAPNNAWEAYLAGFTNYSNYTLYKPTCELVELATAIGPSMLSTETHEFLTGGLDVNPTALADDHCLGHWFRSQGRRVQVVAEPVVVAKHGAGGHEVLHQIIRWLMLPRTVLNRMMPHAALALAAGSVLNTAASTLAYAGLVLAAFGAGSGLMMTVGGLGMMASEALALVFVENAYTRRRFPRRPWRHLLWVPVVQLTQGFLLLAALVGGAVRWRGARIGISK